MNLKARILVALQSNGTLRKQQLLSLLQVSDSYFSVQMAGLTRAFLVNQSKGFYTITPKGRDLIEHDPELATIKAEKGYKPSAKITSLPDFSNKYACFIMQHEMGKFDFNDDILETFAFAWLRKHDLVPPIDKEPALPTEPINSGYYAWLIDNFTYKTNLNFPFDKLQKAIHQVLHEANKEEEQAS